MTSIEPGRQYWHRLERTWIRILDKSENLVEYRRNDTGEKVTERVDTLEINLEPDPVVP